MEKTNKSDVDWELDYLRYIIMYDSDGNLKAPSLSKPPQHQLDAVRYGNWALPEKNGKKNGK